MLLRGGNDEDFKAVGIQPIFKAQISGNFKQAPLGRSY
jgi:hypothetical protein